MRDLYVLMAELATAPANRHKLTPGASSVTQPMVDALEAHIDALDELFDPPTEFVVPGGNAVSAWLDLGRTVMRRAERAALVAAPAALARRALPQPAQRPAVDDGPLAGGHQPAGARLSSAGRRRAALRGRHRGLLDRLVRAELTLEVDQVAGRHQRAELALSVTVYCTIWPPSVM